MQPPPAALAVKPVVDQRDNYYQQPQQQQQRQIVEQLAAAERQQYQQRIAVLEQRNAQLEEYAQRIVADYETLRARVASSEAAAAARVHEATSALERVRQNERALQRKVFALQDLQQQDMNAQPVLAVAAAAAMPSAHIAAEQRPAVPATAAAADTKGLSAPAPKAYYYDAETTRVVEEDKALMRGLLDRRRAALASTLSLYHMAHGEVSAAAAQRAQQAEEQRARYSVSPAGGVRSRGPSPSGALGGAAESLYSYTGAGVASPSTPFFAAGGPSGSGNLRATIAQSQGALYALSARMSSSQHFGDGVTPLAGYTSPSASSGQRRAGDFGGTGASASSFLARDMHIGAASSYFGPATSLTIGTGAGRF
jgi:hypothetical protein